MTTRVGCAHQVVVLRHPAMAYEATVAFVAPVGSRREEDPADHGIAHILEHLLFKGGQRFTSQRAVSEAFLAIGGHTNAFTSHELTCYYATVAIPDPTSGHLRMARTQKAIDILRDMVVTPRIHTDLTDQELATELRVIQEEIRRQDDNPSSLVHSLAMRHVYGADPGMDHDIAGTVAGVERMTMDRIRAWHRQWYARPTVVIAGAFSAAEVLQLQTHLQGPVTGGGLPYGDKLGKKWQAECWARGTPPEPRVHRMPGGAAQAAVVLSYPVDLLGPCDPTASTGDLRGPQMRHLQVLCHVLGGSMASRLWRAVRETQGLAYTVSVSLSTLTEGTRIVVSTGTADRAGAVRTIRHELGRLFDGSADVTEDEVQQSLTVMTGGTAVAMPSSKAHVLHYLDHFVHGGDAESLDDDLLAMQQMANSIDRTTRIVNLLARVVFHPSCAHETVVH